MDTKFAEGDKIVDRHGDTAVVEQVRGAQMAVTYDWQGFGPDEPGEPFWTLMDEQWMPVPPRDGTIEAHRAAYDARTKLAHSRISRDDWVNALRETGLAYPGYSYEATADVLISRLPVHDGCVAQHAWTTNGAVESARREGWQK